MSCPMMPSHLDPIADELLDKSTKWYPNHTIYTHFGCVLIRITMGLLLIGYNTEKDVRLMLIGLIILCLISFGNKYRVHNVKENKTYWKGYLRMIAAYSTSLSLIAMKEEKLAGMLIIADGLMGMNSRHMASVLSCGIKK